jgi:hypothetical protein
VKRRDDVGIVGLDGDNIKVDPEEIRSLMRNGIIWLGTKSSADLL